MMDSFMGGNIDIRYKVDKSYLYLDYSLDGEKTWVPCIEGKSYQGFHANGYIGITAGNPDMQNINNIDVHRIDFFNMNNEFYKHDAHEIVDHQSYYKRDENGFKGKTAYPYSAKLSTIKMGEVAIDIFEMLRNNKLYMKEQSYKALNVIKGNDDIGEVLFKLNEQMLTMNKYMEQIAMTQISKRHQIYSFEEKLMQEKDYKYFVDELETQDQKLYTVSHTFSELTT
jgi:hypothetical protein